tara:strand:- start:1419 stop:1901 length:483 start_codon:yes stop_codon:yes gene_type:complete
MFKIKLLILLLVSLSCISCISNKGNNDGVKYSLGYIGGEFEGLLLKNYLKNYLLSFDLYDENSNYEIKSSISHSSNLYITNIDNTSDRTRIKSTLNIEINDLENICSIDNFNRSVSQFLIYADGSKYISNNAAIEKIKKENTESLVKSFINSMDKENIRC